MPGKILKNINDNDILTAGRLLRFVTPIMTGIILYVVTGFSGRLDSIQTAINDLNTRVAVIESNRFTMNDWIKYINSSEVPSFKIGNNT